MLAAVERATGSLPIDDFTPIAPPTNDVRRGEVCAVSGLTPNGACPRVVTEWMPAGSAPHDCTWHHASDQGVVTIWPANYRHWARSEGLLRDVSASETPRGSERSEPRAFEARGGAPRR